MGVITIDENIHKEVSEFVANNKIKYRSNSQFATKACKELLEKEKEETGDFNKKQDEEN